MATRKKISFATFNLLNLNLPGLPIYRDRDGWDQKTYDKKIAWSSNTVAGLAAEVWGLQELWNAEPLQDRFTKVGLLSDYALLVPDNHRGRIVCAGAVRKKLLVDAPRWIERFPEKFMMGWTAPLASSLHWSIPSARLLRNAGPLGGKGDDAQT